MYSHSKIACHLLLAAMTAFFLFSTVETAVIKISASASIYLRDSENDSSNSEVAPWGEIIEVRVEADAIVVKAKGIFNRSLTSIEGEGFLLLFFDEDFDNRTDVVLRFAKSVDISGGLRNLCYLYRFGNRSYYFNGNWNYSKGLFDEKIEENATLSETTFHLGKAVERKVKLKAASYYYYDIYYKGAERVQKIGGDTAPDCPWNVSDITFPPRLETPAQIVNDTRFPYPDEALMLGEPEEPSGPSPPTPIDYFISFFSSVQIWMANNTVTLITLAIFSLAAAYSISNRIRPFLNVLVAYLTIAGLIYASATTGSVFLPLLFSVALLLPLFVWYRSAAVGLSSELNVRGRLVWVEVLTLFFLGLLIRVPFTLFVFPIPLEKTPLVYLVVLAILLINKNSLSVYGLRKDNLARSIFTGLAYYLTYGIPFFVLVFGLTYLFTGYLAFDYYYVPFALWTFPFMTLCVAVSEELLFRGFIQTRVARVYGKNKALFVQALLFGAWHFVYYVLPFDPIGMTDRFLSTFALGLAFGLFYKHSGNLIPLIIFHGITDTILMGASSPLGIYVMGTLFESILRVSMIIGLVAQLFATRLLAQKSKFDVKNHSNKGDQR